MLRAKGRILVTGLGLGCVVRGLLANPAVEHVTCIEKSPDVMKLVAPYMPRDRLTIIQADALEWAKFNEDHFDYAWHDLWTDRDKGEPHLDLWHTRLMFDLIDCVEYQGAWSYDRAAKRLMNRTKVKLIP
jgi:spermidine synthase